MRMRSFMVQGLGNFTKALDLGPLEDLNVISGANNTGKSNLIRAVELYFRLLAAGDGVAGDQVLELNPDDPALEELLKRSFNWERPRTITFQVYWEIPREE